MCGILVYTILDVQKVLSKGHVAISWCCHAVSFCHEWCHACELCTQLLTLSAWVSLWRRMNQRRNCCPTPPDSRAPPFLAHVHLAAPGLGSRWRCHSTCLQVEAASSWDRTNTPAGRPGPGQDSCGLVPCLHKHTAAAGVSSLAGCANAP